MNGMSALCKVLWIRRFSEIFGEIQENHCFASQLLILLPDSTQVTFHVFHLPSRDGIYRRLAKVVLEILAASLE